MATQLGEEPKPIVMKQVFRPETEDVNNLTNNSEPLVEKAPPEAQEKQ